MDRVVDRNRGKKAFSLVELVIVVVIIGIIAAIAIPRLSQGARGAAESALRSDLAVLRNAIEVYASEHGGDHPGAKDDGAGGGPGSPAAFENQLLKYTDVTGKVSNVKDGTHQFGPYLRKQIPPLPVGKNAGQSTVSVANNGPAVAPDDPSGWVYNCDTGEIIANSDDSDEAGASYDQY